MDIFLKSKTDADWFRFPIMPDSISVKTSAKAQSINIIGVGEVKVPRGTQLTGYSWNGIFPHESNSGHSFVFDWQEPTAIVQKLREWQEAGETLTLMVTELCINEDVFIEGFNYEYRGIGDCSYTINLSVRRELTITTVPMETLPEDSPAAVATQTGKVKGAKSVKYRSEPSNKATVLGSHPKGTVLQLISKKGSWWKFEQADAPEGFAWMNKKYIKVTATKTSSGKKMKDAIKSVNKGIDTKKSNTYTVQSGDTLYTIAKSQLGDGTRYMELYMLNRTSIDSLNFGKEENRLTIYVGLILKLPT